MRRVERIKKAAKKGALFLDARYPGWAAHVDPQTLNMAVGYYCVLGQRFDAYFLGESAIKALEPKFNVFEHGFKAPTYVQRFCQAEYDAYYREMTEVWKPLIEERKVPAYD